jgi:hypothetical protein
MPTDITKLLVRRGTNDQRLYANYTGIVFSLGEPGYAYDVQRLYMGDGATAGGHAVGMRNLGLVTTLFGTYGGSGLSEQAYNAFRLSAAEVGDIIYDVDTRNIYSLSSRNTWPPTSNDLAKLDVTVVVNPTQLEFNTSKQLQIKAEGIGPRQLAGSVVGNGLIKLNTDAPLQIQPSGVTNDLLAVMAPNTAKVNISNSTSNPVDLYLKPKQVIGRTSSSTLTAVDFSVILSEANTTGLNGITIESPAPGVTIWSLSAGIFEVKETSDFNNSPVYAYNVFQPTTIYNTLSVVNIINTTGGINCYGPIRTFNNSINAGVGSLTAGSVITRDINTQGLPIYAGSGSITCGSINAGAGNITTTGNIAGNIINASGNINTSSNLNVTGDVYARVVYATGDMVAYYTSDERLKNNIKPLEGSLQSLDKINGYSFTWNQPQEGQHIARAGDDIGLIAQEVKEILPLAVNEREDGYLGIDYTRMVPYLVSCIKELKQEIQTLKNEIRQTSSNATKRI